MGERLGRMVSYIFNKAERTGMITGQRDSVGLQERADGSRWSLEPYVEVDNNAQVHPDKVTYVDESKM